jgi:anti-anti-sigma regulatory factor
MLLLLYRHFAAKSGEVILVAVPEEIRDTMSMTGFSSFFTFLDHASDPGPGRS